MKQLVAGTIAAGVLMMAPSALMAQSKTLTSEVKTVTATIEAIETSTRSVTFKKTDGTYVTTVAGPDVKRFAELKVGDKVTAKYYENVVVRVKQPGEPDLPVKEAMASKSSGQALPGGTQARQVSITATITAIDTKVPSISFTGPHDWKYTSKVEDTKALGKVKVGDKVDIVWTEALLMSVERGK
jgi:uncharacterized OB-fold protein